MSIKSRMGSILLSNSFQRSLSGHLMRRLVAKTNGLYNYSPQFLSDSQATSRPHYTYCLIRAANLAQRLGISRISAIEFGVAGGNGLAFMADFSKLIARQTGVTIDCYGFDTGEGMPEPENVRDLPYWFKRAQYVMDEQKLRKRLPQTMIIIGNAKKTIPTFIDTHKPAPIAAIFHDMDYWSSTRDALKLLEYAEQSSDHFMPRIFNYFDDTIGTDWEMYGTRNGQLLAIEEFNDRNPDCQIHLNQNLLPNDSMPWRYQIYYTHLFNHPRYSDYIGGAQQVALQGALELK